MAGELSLITLQSCVRAQCCVRQVTQRVRLEYLPYLPLSGHEWSLVTHRVDEMRY